MFSDTIKHAVSTARTRGELVGHPTARAIAVELCDQARACSLTIPADLAWFVEDGSYTADALREVLDAAREHLCVTEDLDVEVLAALMQYAEAWAKAGKRKAPMGWSSLSS